MLSQQLLSNPSSKGTKQSLPIAISIITHKNIISGVPPHRGGHMESPTTQRGGHMERGLGSHHTERWPHGEGLIRLRGGHNQHSLGFHIL